MYDVIKAGSFVTLKGEPDTEVYEVLFTGPVQTVGSHRVYQEAQIRTTRDVWCRPVRRVPLADLTPVQAVGLGEPR